MFDSPEQLNFFKRFYYFKQKCVSHFLSLDRQLLADLPSLYSTFPSSVASASDCLEFHQQALDRCSTLRHLSRVSMLSPRGGAGPTASRARSVAQIGRSRSASFSMKECAVTAASAASTGDY